MEPDPYISVHRAGWHWISSLFLALLISILFLGSRDFVEVRRHYGRLSVEKAFAVGELSSRQRQVAELALERDPTLLERSLGACTQLLQFITALGARLVGAALIGHLLSEHRNKVRSSQLAVLSAWELPARLAFFIVTFEIGRIWLPAEIGAGLFDSAPPAWATIAYLVCPSAILIPIFTGVATTPSKPVLLQAGLLALWLWTLRAVFYVVDSLRLFIDWV